MKKLRMVLLCGVLCYVSPKVYGQRLTNVMRNAIAEKFPNYSVEEVWKRRKYEAFDNEPKYMYEVRKVCTDKNGTVVKDSLFYIPLQPDALVLKFRGEVFGRLPKNITDTSVNYILTKQEKMLVKDFEKNQSDTTAINW